MSVVALSGGVGGAKLAHGLYQALEPDTLTLIVNTGDDFDHYGLRICPDLDTALYTLAGIANEATGWGVADDTWTALDMLRRYGVDAWFQGGDAQRGCCGACICARNTRGDLADGRQASPNDCADAFGRAGVSGLFRAP